MSSSNKLSVDTEVFSDKNIQPQTPQLVPLSTTSTATTVTETAGERSPDPVTPKNERKLQREEQAKAFVDSIGLVWDELDDFGKDRARRLMSEDYSHSPSQDSSENGGGRYSTTFGKEFVKFCNALPDGMGKEAWKNCSRVFFSNEAIGQYLVIRMQRAGICCLHAAVVFQHYLQSLRNLQQHGAEFCDHKMLDISEFLRTKLSTLKQKDYVEKGTCGLGSIEFFLMITGLQSDHLEEMTFITKAKSKTSFTGDVDKLLELYNVSKQPALVTCFAVEENFSNSKTPLDGHVEPQRFRDYGKMKGLKNGNRSLHSMVMLGMHKDEESGKVWILLQNFWRDDYFRLVSAEYLACCKPTIWFLNDDDSIDVSLKDNPPMTNDQYAETEVQFEECYPRYEEEVL